MQRKRRQLVAFWLAGMLMFAAGRMSSAIDLGDILKVGGIGFLVKQFAKPLNSFINTLMVNQHVENKDATKVVPILSVGSGGYIGAAQVNGKKDVVSKVQAVAQLEGTFSGGKFRAKGLIPIDSLSVTSLRRVYGVGLSALIDVQL